MIQAWIIAGGSEFGNALGAFGVWAVLSKYKYIIKVHYPKYDSIISVVQYIVDLREHFSS